MRDGSKVNGTGEWDPSGGGVVTAQEQGWRSKEVGVWRRPRSTGRGSPCGRGPTGEREGGYGSRGGRSRPVRKSCDGGWVKILGRGRGPLGWVVGSGRGGGKGPPSGPYDSQPPPRSDLRRTPSGEVWTDRGRRCLWCYRFLE